MGELEAGWMRQLTTATACNNSRERKHGATVTAASRSYHDAVATEWMATVDHHCEKCSSDATHDTAASLSGENHAEAVENVTVLHSRWKA